MSTVNQNKKLAQQDTAVKSKEASTNVFEGTVVRLADNKLVMKNKEGKEYTHTLIKDAKLTCDGTVCTPEDMKAGKRIRVTTNKDDHTVATRIESLNKNTEFAHSS